MEKDNHSFMLSSKAYFDNELDMILASNEFNELLSVYPEVNKDVLTNTYCYKENDMFVFNVQSFNKIILN